MATAENLELELARLNAGIKQNNILVDRTLKGVQKNQVAYLERMLKLEQNVSKLAPLLKNLKPLLRLAGIALNIVAALEQIGQFVVFAQRLDALESRSDRIESGLSEVLGKTGSKISGLQSRVQRNEAETNKLRDEVSEAQGDAAQALLGISVIKDLVALQTRKLENLNDITAEAKSNARKALIQNTSQQKDIDLLKKQRLSLNNQLAEAKTRIKEGIRKDQSQDQAINGVKGEVAKLKADTGINTIKEQVAKLNELLKQTDAKATTALEEAKKKTKGDKGDKGDRGISVKGDKGDKGDPGISIKGDKGDPGKDVDSNTVRRIQSQLDAIARSVSPIAIMAVALTGLKDDVKKMPSSEAFTTGVAKGTCSTLKPGGCMRKEMDGLGNGIGRNSGKLDKINAALSGYDAAISTRILNRVEESLTRLGPAIPGGGISGRLGKMFDLGKRTWDFLQVDRVLSILTYITALHNAYFLSSSLGQTLFSAVSNVLAAIGIKDSEGQPLDVGQIVGQWTESFFKQIFGVATVDGIKAEWKKASRVYQAASNVIWSVQSIFDSTRSLLDLAIENTGKIGNALRKAGAVLENAYGPLVEKATARNKFQKRLDDFTNGVGDIENVISNIDSAASEVLSIQETVGQINEQRTEFQASVDAFKSDQTTKETQTKTASAAPQL
jgi:uncharacterized protein (UPF0335 family)